MSQANLSFPVEFGLKSPDPEVGYYTPTDEWIDGIINAIIFLTAGLM